jgi:hypothetical protein
VFSGNNGGVFILRGNMKISKQELESRYWKGDNKSLCFYLGISEPTLIKLLKENGITLKGKGGYCHLVGSKRKVEVYE